MTTSDKPSGIREENLTEEEVENAEERLRLRAPVVYEIVRAEGEAELTRPISSLWWSGVAAGLCISMSVVAEGLLRGHLPDTEWRPLIENFGYSVGFLIVVLGRLQLFTENTITAVLPLAAERTRHNLFCTARLWGVVLVANLVGTFLFAVAAVHAGLFAPDQIEWFRQISLHFMAKPPVDMALHGVVAGFLIAAMVWMTPSAEGADFLIITVITYLIALGEFTHVVAGSAEAFLLLILGDVGVSQVLLAFLIPALVGNVLGGTALFAMLAYAQVREEI